MVFAGKCMRRSSKNEMQRPFYSVIALRPRQVESLQDMAGRLPPRSSPGDVELDEALDSALADFSAEPSFRALVATVASEI